MVLRRMDAKAITRTNAHIQIFFDGNEIEQVVSKMSAIMFSYQCVNCIVGGVAW